MLATVVAGSFLVTIYGGDVYFPFVLFVAVSSTMWMTTHGKFCSPIWRAGM